MAQHDDASVRKTVELARVMVGRLERLSADSAWARRSSGARGALLKLLERLEGQEDFSSSSLRDLEADLEQMEHFIDFSFNLLKRAAREIPDPDP